MKDVSRVCILRGLAELFGAAVCLLIVVIMFSAEHKAPRLGVLVLGVVILTADGLASLWRSRTIARFQ